MSDASKTARRDPASHIEEDEVALWSDRQSPHRCGGLMDVVTLADDDRMKSKPLFVFAQPRRTGTAAACHGAIPRSPD
jgi:hypothetical protein